jgi:hypothetical protein
LTAAKLKEYHIGTDLMPKKHVAEALAEARSTGRGLLVWSSKDPGEGPDDAMVRRVEDGFLRSRGLGAELVPPLSLVTDDLGIYYDPHHESRLERMIASRASLRMAQQRFAEAADAYSAAAVEYAASLGDHHLNAARARFNAAQLRVHLQPGSDAADADFAAAIESASRARPPLSPLPMFFRASFARQLLQRGQTAQAREVLLPAQGWPQLDDFDPANRADFLDLLARLYGLQTAFAAVGDRA